MHTPSRLTFHKKERGNRGNEEIQDRYEREPFQPTMQTPRCTQDDQFGATMLEGMLLVRTFTRYQGMEPLLRRVA